MAQPTKKDILASLKKHFNLSGTLELIYGEIDLNYRLTTSDNTLYLVKIGNPHSDIQEAIQQQELLFSLKISNSQLPLPVPLETVQQKLVAHMSNSSGSYSLRLLSWLPGSLWSSVNPHPKQLRYQLGKTIAKLDGALKNIQLPPKSYNPNWDIANGLWVTSQFHLFKNEELELLQTFTSGFKKAKPHFDGLKKQWIHNDLNDNNILVQYFADSPQIAGIIDFGDASYTQTICELAICAAYVMIDYPDPLDAIKPLIKGYHEQNNLEESELEILYHIIAMRLVISATFGRINALDQPENNYLQISQKAIWDNLKRWSKINPHFAHFYFRNACGLAAHPKQEAFEIWAESKLFAFNELFPTTTFNDIFLLDLSVASTWIGPEWEFNNLDLFSFKIEQLQKSNPDQLIAGGYLEPRPIYTDSSYDRVGNYGPESRRVHLGIDFWLPAFTPVHSLLDGTVVTATNDAGPKEYGGLIILKHQENSLEFYTLYGHLSVASALEHKVGDCIKAGEKIGKLGPYPENGNWAPHLHFEFMLSLLDYTHDFPGVAYSSQVEVWKSLCPDPNLLFKNPKLVTPDFNQATALLDERKNSLGYSMSLQYDTPLHIVRGEGAFLIDAFGRPYLDTVNNVAHVGHEHPKVVKAGQQQMALLNTNTRYLHANINALAQQLLATLPEDLSVVHFVNSGSEANELALRMVKAVTGSEHMLASEVGYHGNTNACIRVSSYKFDGKGGAGAPENTHIFPLPDTFRGKYQGLDAGQEYVKEVALQIEKLRQEKNVLGGLILESILSCGGQIELPEGFLASVYKLVREAGGLCIADEVQTGLGRVGKAFWAFELHGVVPDIVTIGKPLGNGHPIAAVVCTKKVATAFANGMEYFNTFGGNPVSCAIGSAVLNTVINEGLQENALSVGEFLKKELLRLSEEFPIIAQVRGQGLFLGFELTDGNKKPLAQATAYLVNRMKDYGILMSLDGPDHNVIKIKPPMVFNHEHARRLIEYLEKVLREDPMKIN